jgi:nitrogen regulatory protein P-II 1
MKQIKAVIRRHKMDDVLYAPAVIEELPGVMVSEIRGFGKGRDRFAPGKVHEGSFLFVEWTKLEPVVRDDQVGPVLETIRAAGHTGNTGDGKVFVIPVDDCLKIRTGDRGEGAL